MTPGAETSPGPSRPASTGRIPALGLVLCVALAGFWQAHSLTRGVENLGGDQHLVLTYVLKVEDPSLFPKDLAFDDRERISNTLPLYFGFLRAAFRLTGDPTTGYRVLVFPVTLLYLLGAYGAFRHFCRDRWAAVALSLFSSLPTSVILADEFFGVGPVAWMVARTVITGVFPLLFWAFCAWIDRPGRLIFLCLGFGLLANLYPVSPLYAVGMLAITYLLERRATPRAWGVAVGMGGAALVGAGPIIWIQFQQMARQAVISARAGELAVAQVAKEHLGFIAYPPRNLAALPGGIVDALTLGLIIAAALAIGGAWARGKAPGGVWCRLVAAGSVAYLLFPEVKLLWALVAILLCLPQRERGLREERLAVFFSLSVFWITAAELLLVHFGPLDRPALYILLTRGAQFAAFALFLLLALALGQADWARVRRIARVALIGLIIATSLWQVRHTVRTYLRTRGDAAAADLAAVGRWARAETAPQDVFLCDSAAFRLIARRSLVFAAKDHGPIIYNRPERAAALRERMEAVRAAGNDPAALVELGARYGAQYVVIPAANVHGVWQERIRYANRTYAVLATREGFR